MIATLHPVMGREEERVEAVDKISTNTVNMVPKYAATPPFASFFFLSNKTIYIAA